MSRFHLLQLENVSIYLQLQIEEALLRTDNRNWCIINKGSSPAIVMGISGKAEDLIDLEALNSRPMPVIRRFSGGGTVVVDQHTHFVTWIANTQDTQVSCCPTKVLEWSADVYEHVFSDTDFSLKENDFTLGQKKCGGNALYLRKERWLAHTSFLWDYDPAHMQLLKMPPKMPMYRQKRTHDEFLCRLCDHFACYTSFTKSFIEHLERRFDITHTTTAEALPLLERPHRQATSIVQLK